jgi:hypothetical protein
MCTRDCIDCARTHNPATHLELHLLLGPSLPNIPTTPLLTHLLTIQTVPAVIFAPRPAVIPRFWERVCKLVPGKTGDECLVKFAPAPLKHIRPRRLQYRVPSRS